jgi:hypothetical protein
MIVENESNWKTEDLVALLEKILGMEGFERGGHITSNTLLLFTTSRRRTPRVNSWQHRRGETPPPVEMDRSCRRYYNTVAIKIRSAKRLQMEVLDRLANVPGGGVQDMSAANVVKVAECIARALGNWHGTKLNFDWAKTFSMRTSTKNRRSETGVQRRIECLRDSQDDLRRICRAEIQKIEKKIQKLQR